MPFTVVVIDDDPDMRALFSVLIDADPSLALVGEADTGETGTDLAAAKQPDLVVLDLTMPGTGGLASLPAIRAAAPGASVVMVTGVQDDTVRSAAIRSGASAFLHKGPELSESLLPTLHRIVDVRDQRGSSRGSASEIDLRDRTVGRKGNGRP
ncbi:MAG TPA: response regulator transcription factor [Acidimicrobiales bacterium]|nr:response regulator transcription factor [Acidimicrobiales bacterium]